MSNSSVNRVSKSLSTMLMFACVAFWTVTTSLSSAIAADSVNINTADAETISSSIDGIGPVKAQAIVNYREQYGDFKTLDDLQNVPGIGQIMFDRIKASLSLTGESPESDSTAQLETQLQ